ncbi:MAG TPA: glycosyltransferase [Nitrososphaera sp.]|nr:glycosyltransferase [Nitrososphaera sp.]
MTKVVLLAGGGGHTAYAYALAQHLSGKCEILSVVPEGDSLSKSRMQKLGDVRTLIKPRGPKTPLGPFAIRMGISFLHSSSIASSSRDIIVSTGSNFCIAPCLHAKARGNPIVNIESSVRFVKASTTVKLLSRIARLNALQWEEQKKLIPNGEVVGPMLAKREIEPHNGGYILVTGGTHGHKALFECLSMSAMDNVLLQAGPLYGAFLMKNPAWKVIDYTDQFHELIAGAEVVVTHFGETCLDSALVYGKPTVISVNPDWTRTAGMEDARILAKKLGAVLLDDFTPESLIHAIEEAKRLPRPVYVNGAEVLSRRILGMMKK